MELLLLVTYIPGALVGALVSLDPVILASASFKYLVYSYIL